MGNIDITDYAPAIPPRTSRGGTGRVTGPSVNQNDKTFSHGYARDSEEVNSNERLNLGLGRNSCMMDIEQECPQEGERSNRRYQWERHMAMIGVLAGKTIFQSLGGQPRSLVHETSREWGPWIARFNNDGKGFGVTQKAIVPVEATRGEWPGSFHMV
ncbi:PREDICTED: uncharacterized protein LOC105119313 [Populus euphratica]|uniref:Uncharacterized protein LOC105119313 n=1 Tax=Populus euphratica TaxID=75702 RepID=A0AAJ6TRK8_POPEU|nr:PREDICTED: uncharacterized protein LOC105119313 [Populus euphratica]